MDIINEIKVDYVPVTLVMIPSVPQTTDARLACLSIGMMTMNSCSCLGE